MVKIIEIILDKQYERKLLRNMDLKLKHFIISNITLTP